MERSVSVTNVNNIPQSCWQSSVKQTVTFFLLFSAGQTIPEMQSDLKQGWRSAAVVSDLKYRT